MVIFKQLKRVPITDNRVFTQGVTFFCPKGILSDKGMCDNNCFDRVEEMFKDRDETNL